MTGAALLTTVMLIHGGGFTVNTPGQMDPVADAYRAAGYRVMEASYTLGDPRQALRDVEHQAATLRRGHRHVVAFGVSVGGTLAALLADTGAVDGAVVWTAPLDLRRWSTSDPDCPGCGSPAYWQHLHMTEADEMRMSPVLRVGRHTTRQLVLYGTTDRIVGTAQALAYGHRLGERGKVERMAGVGHAEFPAAWLHRAVVWTGHHYPVAR
jgi:acetyl esterase/lipase